MASKMRLWNCTLFNLCWRSAGQNLQLCRWTDIQGVCEDKMNAVSVEPSKDLRKPGHTGCF